MASFEDEVAELLDALSGGRRPTPSVDAHWGSPTQRPAGYRPAVWFGVLGHLEVRRTDGAKLPVAGPARRQLLAALVSRPGAVIPAPTLVEELWGAAAPRSAATTLRSHILRLRNDLASGGVVDVLLNEADGYRLDIDRRDVDAGRFEGFLEQAAQEDDPHAALRLYDDALALWRDEAYLEFGDAPFAVLERVRLSEIRALARERRTDLALTVGLAEDLMPELEQRVRIAPYRERGWEQLALALYRTGRQADALEACRRARRVLRDDLGVDPGPSLQTLEQRLLRQDAQLLPAVAVAPIQAVLTDRCPYKGLSGYEEADAALFVGRERLASTVIARLAEQRAAVVTGASGVGKSSLVRAGVVAALRSGALPGSAAWRVTVGTPHDLLTGTSDSHPDVLVVDQAEELFTEPDARVRATMLRRLADILRRDDGRLLLVLRGDFFGRLAEIPALAPFAENNAVLVGPMRADDVRRTLVEPAAAAGLRLEDELVETIMDSVAGQPETLPLLSEAMVRTWERRRGNLLTLDGYRQAGELAGALQEAAEECFRRWDAPTQRAARRLLLRMAARTDAGWVRRPVSRADVVDADEQRSLDALIEARLISADHQHCRLAHEALFLHWERLRGWLDERALGVDLLHHLQRASKEWRAGGQVDADLYRGARLSAALDWRAEHPDDLSHPEAEFLDASRSAAEAELRTARERAVREAHGRRRLRAVVAVLAVVLLGAAAAAVVAARERSHADDAATIALANGLGGQAVGEPDLDLAELLAIAGERLHPSTQTQSALLRTVLRAPSAVRIYHGDGLRVNGVALSPDGRTLALEDNVPNVFLLDTATGRRIGEIPDHLLGGPPSALAFTPEGRLLFLGGGLRPDAVEVLDPSSGRIAQRLLLPQAVLATVHAGDVTDPTGNYGGADLAIDTSGRQLAAAIGDDVVQWDLGTGAAVAHPFAVPGNTGEVVYTPDGRRLVVPQQDRTSVLDAASGRVLATYPVGGRVAAVSPDGHTVVIGDDTGALHFVDVRTAVVRTAFSAHPGGVSGLDFTPDSTRLVSSGADGVMRTWGVATREVQQSFAGHASTITGQVLDALGTTAYTASSDGTVIGWDLTGTRGLARAFQGFRNPSDFSASVAVAPGSTRLAVGGSDGTVHLWNLSPLHEQGHFAAVKGAVAALSFSPDGTSLLVAGDALPGSDQPSGSLRIWGLEPAPHVAHDLHGFWRIIWAGFSSDGATVAASGSPQDAPGGFAQRGRGDAVVGEWSAATGRPLGSTVRLSGGGEGYAADFVGNGPTLAVAQLGDRVSLVAPARQRIVHRFVASSAEFLVGAAVSPNGRTLATVDFDGYLSRWDAGTGAAAGARIRVSEGSTDSVAWSPDGTQLVTAGADGTVRILDASSGQELGTPIAVGGDSPTARFTPDGHTVVVLDGSGRVSLYPADAAGWAAYGCQLASRTLTRAEWAQYLPGHAYRTVCPSG